MRVGAGGNGKALGGIHTIMNNKSLVPGITPTSLLASLFAMLLMGMVVQYAEVVLGISGSSGFCVLPLENESNNRRLRPRTPEIYRFSPIA